MAAPIFSTAHFQSEEVALALVQARVWPNGPVCEVWAATGERIRQTRAQDPLCLAA
jgi:hypothetical protein